MMTYTGFKVNLDGTLSHKELLDNLDELNTWVEQVKFGHILVIQDQTNKQRHGFLTSDSEGKDYYDFSSN